MRLPPYYPCRRRYLWLRKYDRRRTLSLQKEVFMVKEIRKKKGTLSLQKEVFMVKEIRQKKGTLSLQKEVPPYQYRRCT